MYTKRSFLINVWIIATKEYFSAMKLKTIRNSSLILKYEDIYQKGAYKKFFSFNKNSIHNSLLKSISNWNKLDVLDFGCGEGDLSNMIAKKKQN